MAVEEKHEKWWNQRGAGPKTSKEKCEIKSAVKKKKEENI
jgi:hypothetical protein